MTAPPPPTLAQLLSAHPWPARYANAARVEFLWHFEVAMPVAQLWPLVADSSRMNRALGVAQMHFAPRENGELWGTSRPGGLWHEWREVPWNWVAGQYIESLRDYTHGFSRAVWGVFTFQPLGPESTRVNVYFGAVPRHLLGRAVLKLGFGAMQKDFARIYAELAAQYAAAKAARMPAPDVAPLPDEARVRLRRAGEETRAHGVDADVVDRLLRWVETGDEADLVRIQVKERAAVWGVDETTLLRAALHLTRSGALQISWDLICPHCRGPAENFGELGTLTAKGACQLCEIDFDSRSPESVEISFHVHPSIRAVERRTFCSAEPALKAHIRAQHEVAAQATLTLRPELAPGTYRVRAHASRDYSLLEVNEAAPSEATWTPGQAQRLALQPGGSLRFHNPGQAPLRVVLEGSRWSDLALRPAQLFSLQEYRDLFSEDYLATDVQLAVGEQTILFTDIVGSTAMYAERGDPAAFAEVRRHFDEVFAEVAKHRGAVVKTIGDAVMATFSSALDAVKASAGIHARFPPSGPDAGTRLRISLNTGPCIAVKLNTGVDYFGHTVNLAAKLQALAESWQVAMSETTWLAPGVAEYVTSQGRPAELEFRTKALPAPVPVRQWTVYAETPHE